MKKITLLSCALLFASQTLFAQANSSYYLNSSIISGSYNAAFGAFALYDMNINGTKNSAFGYEALVYTSSGKENSAFGFRSLRFNLLGYGNTGIGYEALEKNQDGNYNTAIGYHALKNNSSGGNNTASGYLALSMNTTGTLNTGYGMYCNTATTGQYLSSSFGSFAIANASNKIRFGTTMVTVIEGQVPYSNPSDGRFKTNIKEEDVIGLEFIKRLRPVVYNFDTKKFQEFLTQNMPDSMRQEYFNQDFSASTAVRQSGFIAQEVETASQESNYNFNGLHVPNDKNDNYSLAYAQFVVPLVKGMQEQQKMIEDLQKEINDLKKLVASQANSSLQRSKLEINDNVSIFPNPNKGRFTVEIRDLNEGSILIQNANGATIKTIRIIEGTTRYNLDLTSESKGIYLVSVVSKETNISRKIVVE